MLRPTPNGADAQLVTWVLGLVRSNSILMNVLAQLRDCYRSSLAGELPTDANDIMVKVERALRDAERARTIA